MRGRLRQIEQKHFRAFRRFHSNLNFLRNGCSIALLELRSIHSDRSARNLNPCVATFLQIVGYLLTFIEMDDIEIRVLMDRQGRLRPCNEVEFTAKLGVGKRELLITPASGPCARA